MKSFGITTCLLCLCGLLVVVTHAVSMTSCLNSGNSETSPLSTRVRTFWDVDVGNSTRSIHVCAMFMGSDADLSKLRTLSAYAFPGGHLEVEHFQAQEGQHVCIDVPLDCVLLRVYSKDFAGRVVDCQIIQLNM